MSNDLRARINELMDTTKMTSSEIIAHIGISYGKFYSIVSRTWSDTRDTQILVYDKVGHDGTGKGDRCMMCTIIMLKDYSEVPDGWGEFQRCWGHICQGCMSDLMFLFPDAVTALITAGCAYCGKKDAGIYFFSEGEDFAPSPLEAVPLCEKHRRIFDEKPMEVILRDFYNRVDVDKLFAITGWVEGRPTPSMPIWDDMLLEHVGDEQCVCHLSGDVACGETCLECGLPVMS